MSALTSANGVQTAVPGDGGGTARDLREGTAAAGPARIRSNYPTREGAAPLDGPDAEVRALLSALPEGVACARELFEAAAEASRDAEYIRRRVERMESGEGARAASLARSSSGSRADVNGTARVNARIDYEASTERRLEEDYALVDLACAVLYGADGRSGVSVLLGPQAADLLWHHYLGGLSWEAAARAVGVPVRSCYRRAQAALDLVDFLTPESAMAGRGGAT